MKRFLLFSTLFLLAATNLHSEVILQGFYWQPQNKAQWWNTLKSQAKEISDMHIDSIWIPSPVEDHSPEKMGYVPYDHYSLNSAFGTEQELKDMIKEMHKYSIKVYVDAVLNHIGFGQKEYNAFLKKDTWTKFTYPHRRFEKNYEDFQPSDNCKDPKTPDFCRAWGYQFCFDSPRVTSELLSWGKWLHDELGVDGYRIDALTCVSWDFMEKWVSSYPMSEMPMIGEYWDTNLTQYDRLIKKTHRKMRLFDFVLWGFVKDMCNDTSGKFALRKLANAGISNYDPDMSITFLENHDTDKTLGQQTINDKILGYSLLLMLRNDTSIFYKDMFVYGLKKDLSKLLEIRKTYTKEQGYQRIIYLDNDLIVMQRDNLIYLLNDSKNAKSVKLATPWRNSTIKDATGHISDIIKTDDTGMPINYNLWCPARSYVCLTPTK